MCSKLISLLILHFSFGVQDFDSDDFENSLRWEIKRKVQISPEMVTNPPPAFFQGEVVEEDDPRVSKQKQTEHIKTIQLIHFLATTIPPHLIPRNWKVPLNGTIANDTSTSSDTSLRSPDGNQLFDNSSNNFTSIQEEQPTAANDTLSEPEHAAE